MIIKLETIDSTNIYAIRNFKKLENGTLITAKAQSAGKGRRQNKWYSPDCENLYCSYVLKSDKYEDAATSSIVGALSIMSLIRNLPNLGRKFIDSLWIKWPNDIYANSKKLSGVLAETVTNSSNKLEGVIIGIGLNVNMNQELCDLVNKPCTSLMIETGITFNVDILAMDLLVRLNELYETSKNKDLIYSLWRKENKLIGKTVRVELSTDEIIFGEVVNISQNGELIIKDSNNKLHSFLSGDVSIKPNKL